MAVFTIIAAKIVTALGFAAFTAAGAATFATLAVSTLLSVGASRLLMKRQMRGASGGGSGGARIQLPPATENKLPVIYGSAYIGGSVTDAKISSDNKTMWYCVAMAEVTDTGSYTFDTNNIYYNGLKVNFGSNGVVTGLVNNTTPPTTDTKMSGQINIYLFPDGANVPGQNTTQTAIQIMQDAQIPAGQQWTATDLMSDCAFAIIKVQYNAEKGTTSLGGITARITNTLSAPGACIKDYMENARYGCAIPTDQIDTASLTALDTYSAQTINYGTGTQQRYRLDGPIDTGTDCLSNLQLMVDSTDSWLQYNEFLGKWSVIINQSYTDYTTIGSLFLIDSSNLVGGIDVAPINLNETYNQLEVAYPNASIRDQTDYQLIKLEDYVPGIMSPNEALNKLDVDYPIVNNSVQSIYLGVRRLLQGREDLTVTFALDYSGIQIQAGDVIRIKQEVYGWDTLNSGEGKLFRVANVSEEKYSDGSLGVRVSAFEYNDTIYADRAILDFQPDPNLGIANPNIMDTPIAPRVILEADDSIAYIKITGTVPANGLFNKLAFQYGTSSDPITHTFYQSSDNGDGSPLTAVLGSVSLLIGQHYSIKTLGTTNWASVGANVIDLSIPLTASTMLIPGKQYIISSVGTTDFTLSGASTNAIGTIYTQNNAVIPIGTGVTIETDFIATGTDVGTGTVDTIFVITMNDLPANTYYWSVRASNDTQGVTSPASLPIVWTGPNVTAPKVANRCRVSNVGKILTLNASIAPDNTTVGICVGGFIETSGGVGEFAANTYVTQINSTTEFEISATMITDLDPFSLTPPISGGSCVSITCKNPITDTTSGGVDGGNIQDDTIPGSKIAGGTTLGIILDDSTWGVVTADPATGLPILTPAAFGAVNEPAFITNTSSTISATKIYPFYQGTSSTTDGYLANSTGAMQPEYSAFLHIVNGQDQWYVFALSLIQGGFRPGQDEIVQTLQLQVVSDVDCTLQIMPFGTFTTAPTTLVCNSQFTYNYELKANHPTGVDFNQDYFGFGGTGQSIGYCARVVQSTGIVTVVSGDLTASVRR
jgi:hypothetical protein